MAHGRWAMAAVVIAFTSTFTGCAGDPTRPAIFDRAQTVGDALPADAATADLDPASSRYVGQDSDGDDYWVAQPPGVLAANICIVYKPAQPEDSTFIGCGQRGLSLTTDDGKRVEFAVDPLYLNPNTAELVGGTLLVGR